MAVWQHDQELDDRTGTGFDWRPASTVVLGVLLTIAGGALIASGQSGWAIAIGAVLGGIAALAMVQSTQICLLAVVAVMTLLPYGVLPLPLGGLKPTFLDSALLMLMGVWILATLARRGDGSERLNSSPLNLFVLVFVGLSFVSYFIGVGMAGATPEATRLYLKLVNSILIFFTAVNVIRLPAHIRQVLLVLFIGAGLSAIGGIILWYMPDDLSTRVLSLLGPLGYPTGSDVLRYDSATGIERAISTQVDPNILGTLLMVGAAIGVTQFLSPQRILPRRLIAPLTLVMLYCLILTRSRSSWVGFVLSLLFVATLRYRKLWYLFILAIIAGGVLAYFGLLQENESVAHLISGFEAQDQASAMRLGEYKDALVLIQRYPWFGAGFGNAPDIDTYIGVSNMYLMMASTMGMVGLSVFMLTIGGFFTITLTPLLRHRFKDAHMESLLISLLAALIGGLVAGMGDYHFFNPKFPHMVALFWLLISLGIIAVELGVQPEQESREEQILPASRSQIVQTEEVAAVT